jgi:tetratricopeptide (TPR) repeat protein
MNRQEAEHLHHMICKLILTNQIGDGIESLEKFVVAARLPVKLDEVSEYKEIYRNMLNYTVKGIIDPQRNQIFLKIQLSLIETCDFTLQFALSNLGLHIDKMRRELRLEDAHFSGETILHLDEISFNEELGTVFTGQKDVSETGTTTFRKEVVRKSFYLGWLCDKLTESDLELLERILHSNRFSWIERCLVVSGLSLGLQRHFDKEKFIILNKYRKSDDPMVSQRALAGLIIAFYLYDDRIWLFSDLESIFEDIIKDTPQEIIKHLILQLLKACDTENISKKFKDEIIPEVMRIESHFKEKLALDKLINKDFNLEKNPDWEKIFEDSPDLINKLQEYTDLQMEGSDVLMGTFSMLKHFDFFKKEVNWFLPFYENTDGDGFLTYSDEVKLISSILQNSPFMCNSDKYSMLLNLHNLPQTQRETIIQMLSNEQEQLKELSADKESTDPFIQSKLIITHIIQDLYRFVKLYQLHNEIPDIFQKAWDMPETLHFKTLIDYSNCLPDIAHFYFSRDIFDRALSSYELLSFQQQDNPILYEKAGYCSERIKDYARAIKYYKRAELFDTNHSWLFKRMGLCYRQLKDAETALFYFIEAEKQEPGIANIQSQIGHCYLELKDYKNALEYFFKVELMNQNSHKVWRPIARCCFVLGKFEVSERYYQQIIENESTHFDFMNMAHLLWCKGDFNHALPYYIKCLQLLPDGIDQFIISYNEDKSLLHEHGISQIDIDLLPDILRFKKEELV